MIQKFILPLVAVILLSSCASKFSLVKRKYTKGFYVASSKNHASGKKETDHKNAVVKTVAPETAAASTEKNYPVNDNRFAAIAPVNTAAAYHNANSTTVHSAAHKLTASASNAVPAKETKAAGKTIKPLMLTKINALSSKANGGSADANFIVLVILCFLWFLNLIAVYIKDGKQLTLNFLITFLLDFTIIGGIIFSLLVVLDVVDLK